MLTRRTALALTLMLAAAVFNGCGGSDSTGPGDGTYYFRFKANGTQVSFTQQSSLTATFSNSGNQYVAIFTGFNGTTNAHVQVYDGATITAGTYSGYSISGSALVGVLFGYHDANDVLYTSGGAAVNASVVISEITATTVRGTFSGTMRAAGNADLTVTEGEFYVPRVN